uniref:Putative secreted protein n=1 Tax=Ixodes ricinus TaxID=34613 RepID=A0A147BDK5_IXORI
MMERSQAMLPSRWLRHMASWAAVWQAATASRHRASPGGTTTSSSSPGAAGPAAAPPAPPPEAPSSSDLLPPLAPEPVWGTLLPLVPRGGRMYLLSMTISRFSSLSLVTSMGFTKLSVQAVGASFGAALGTGSLGGSSETASSGCVTGASAPSSATQTSTGSFESFSGFWGFSFVPGEDTFDVGEVLESSSSSSSDDASSFL